jgi:cardiolipin synthase
MYMKDWKKEVLTIPNLLSLFRLALIPVYVVLYLNAREPSQYYLAGGILALSCMTDLIDGKIARHFNMITNLGKLLDPVADKATQFALTLCISFKQPVLWPVLILFVVKESFQLIAMLVALRRGKALNGAIMEGKICTAVLFTSLVIMVLFPMLNPLAVQIIAAIDTLFLLISFAGYVFAYFGNNTLVQDIEE